MKSNFIHFKDRVSPDQQMSQWNRADRQDTNAPGKNHNKARNTLLRVFSFLIHLTSILPILFSGYIVISGEYLEIHWLLIQYRAVFNLAYLILSTIWVVSPIKKKFRSGDGMELAYNLAPIIIYLGLSFGERKPFMAIALFAIWAFYVLYLWSFYSFDDKEDPQYRTKHELGVALIYRRAVSWLVIIFLIPSLVAVFSYKIKSESTAVQMLCDEVIGEVMLDLVEEDADCDRSPIYEQNAETLKMFGNSAWNAMSNEERMSALGKLAIIECGYLGISSDGLRIQVGALEPAEYGHYECQNETITINCSILGNRETVVNTLSHEVFHFYQQTMIRKLERITELEENFASSAYFDEVRRWKANQSHYINGLDFYEAYTDQPIELSARDFAKEQTTTILQFGDRT